MANGALLNAVLSLIPDDRIGAEFGDYLAAGPTRRTGHIVIIDHGQGLLSLYLHLSEFRVKEGEEVEPHQIIALSGGSGRATGPHLHLAVRWQGLYLDPATLLKLKFPEPSAP